MRRLMIYTAISMLGVYFDAFCNYVIPAGAWWRLPTLGLIVLAHLVIICVSGTAWWIYIVGLRDQRLNELRKGGGNAANNRRPTMPDVWDDD